MTGSLPGSRSGVTVIMTGFRIPVRNDISRIPVRDDNRGVG